MCVDWPKTLKGIGKYPSRSACSKMLWNLDFHEYLFTHICTALTCRVCFFCFILKYWGHSCDVRCFYYYYYYLAKVELPLHQIQMLMLVLRSVMCTAFHLQCKSDLLPLDPHPQTKCRLAWLFLSWQGKINLYSLADSCWWGLWKNKSSPLQTAVKQKQVRKQKTTILFCCLWIAASSTWTDMLC